MKNKDIFDLIWLGWCNLWGVACLLFLLCFFIFGGDFQASIHWNSFTELWHEIFKNKKP
jgi:hypothetical protein